MRASVVVLALLAAGCVHIEQASVSDTGDAGSHDSLVPSLSADGRYVAFVSIAPNLTPGITNNAPDVFVRDLLAGTTERVSIDSAGNEGAPFQPSGFSPTTGIARVGISADGRYVAFSSLAWSGSGGTELVYVRDRVAGTTVRVSVAPFFQFPANDDSTAPAISGDGRYIAFQSRATNLVPNTTNDAMDVYVRDRVAGTTERVSVASTGAEANGPSSRPAISADGRYVSFVSRATDLVPGGTTPSRLHTYVHDRQTGVTELVSVDSAGNEANGSAPDPPEAAWSAPISADGRYVAFESDATNLAPDTSNDAVDVYVRDRVAGTTERVSVASTGAQADAGGSRPAISGDGRYVIFESSATSLVPDPTGNDFEVYVRDRAAGTTTRVSADIVGQPGDGGSGMPSISADGRSVSFASLASNLVDGAGSTEIAQVFVRAHPQPVVDEVSPSSVARGVATPITITGSAFVDDAKVSVSNPAAGVSLSNVVVSSTEITAVLAVDADAPTDPRNVLVQNPGTGAGAAKGAWGVCVGCVTATG